MNLNFVKKVKPETEFMVLLCLMVIILFAALYIPYDYSKNTNGGESIQMLQTAGFTNIKEKSRDSSRKYCPKPGYSLHLTFKATTKEGKQVIVHTCQGVFNEVKMAKVE